MKINENKTCIWGHLWYLNYMRQKNLSTSGNASVAYLALIIGVIAFCFATGLFETATKGMVAHRVNLEGETSRLLSIVHANTSDR